MAGSQQRTEKPTVKRLDEARKRGNIPRSREINSVLVLLGGAVALYFTCDLFYEHFRGMIHELWGEGFHMERDAGLLDAALFMNVASHYAVMIIPTLAVVLLAAIGGSLLQTGGLVLAFKAIEPKLSRLNPVAGFNRFTSLRSLVDLVKSTFKLVIVASVVYLVFASERHAFDRMVGQEVSEIVRTFGHLALKVVVRVGLVMFVLSLLDFYYQKWQHRKDLMMTKQEVKEEHKQTEGNPQIRSRIRSMQRTLLRKRMMASVPKASIVITNPTHYAVALAYDSNMEAPKVIARGMNLLAHKIIHIARKHRVPVVQNPPLARALYHQVKIDEAIPVALYRAVAKVLAYIYRQKRQEYR